MKSIILFVFIVSPLFVFSQGITFKGEYSYKKARIFQKAKPVLRVVDLEISDDVFTYQLADKEETETFNFHDQVYLIKAAKGNHAIKYGIFVGLGTGLGAALILSDHYNDPFAKELNDGAIIGGSVLGGALLGALIGSASAKWKTIFENGKVYVEVSPMSSGGSPGLLVLSCEF